MNAKRGRETPQELTALVGDEVQRGFDEAGKFPARIERYGKARKLARETLDYLKSLESSNPETAGLYDQGELTVLADKARALAVCGEYLHFRHYYTVDKIRLHAANFCKVHLLCPLCAIRRGAKTLGAYVQRFAVIKAENPGIKAALVTYTVKDGPDLAERFDHLKKGVESILKRGRRARLGDKYQTEWAKVIGVVGAFEVKRGANSGEWHPHCHMFIVYRGRLDAQAMKDEWEMLTEDSHVLRIDPVKHPNSPEIDFMEIFKYAVKFAEMTRADNVKAFLTLRGRRLIFSAGVFWGVKVPKDLTDGSESLDGLPFVDLFYRYFNGTYTLDATGSPHEWVFAKPDTDEAVDAYKALRGSYERE